MATTPSCDTINIQDPSLLLIESTILSCFEDFKKSQTLNTFNYFKREMESTNLNYVFNKYPVAEDLLKESRQKTASLVSIILQQFSNDIVFLQENKLINKNFSKIKDIEIGAGDFHKGMSTAIVDLINHQKIVFKPTEVDITENFFCFLDWINIYYPLGDYRYQVAGGDNYHWLEFVNYVPCQSKEELRLYYERAGFMLGILYLLNAVDFHYENIIAKGATPVMIDHETIIQPKIHSKNLRYFNKIIPKSIEDSVISTMLLPIHGESFTTLPVGTCGYGYHKQTDIQILKKVAVDRYTDSWRFLTRFAEESFQKQNIPIFGSEAIYPVAYLEEFLTGFEKSYQLLLNYRKFLLEDKLSPISAFANNTVRFIWRDTNLYIKIHNQMKLPKNLVNYEHHKQKIHDYLAVAFKHVPKDSDLRLIHKHEVAQMLRGDVPFFEVNSSSRDLDTEYGTVRNFFEYSAVENIERKLKKLSFEDLEIQKNLIKKAY